MRTLLAIVVCFIWLFIALVTFNLIVVGKRMDFQSKRSVIRLLIWAVLMIALVWVMTEIPLHFIKF